MAVLSRLLVGSQQRLDLPDVLAIESYVSSDFKNLIKSFVGSSPMILKGFEVIDAPLSINQTNVSIRVAGSVLYNSQSSAGSFFCGLEEGHPLATPLVPDLKNNSTNYVYLTLSSEGYAQDTRAFWDVDLNSGEGGEFNQIVNTQSVLKVDINVSVSTFPDGTIPIAKIVKDGSSIKEIIDCRNMMFRLGSGGVSPDPTNKFSFRSLPSLTYTRDEPPISVAGTSAPSPFFGGDKNIFSLKEWMDVVMTKILELSGTTYWYESSAAISLLNLFDDTVGSSIKSKGQWTHDSSVAGKVTWSEDIIYRKMNDPREIIIRSNATGITLDNDEVMFVQMIRNEKINSFNTSVGFENNKNYINGIQGSFSNLKKGDWVKKNSDNDNLYLRVEEFYTTEDLASGAGESANLARSVKLSSTYQGTTETSVPAVYTRGVYENLDIQKANRSTSTMWLLGGGFYWLANRSDTVQNIQSITPVYLTNVNIKESDGKRAKLEFASNHGLSDGDRIVVSNAAAYNGLYQVEVQSSTVVIIETAITTNLSNITVSWAVVTTKERYSDGQSGGILLESANHGFESNQTIKITSTGTNYDSYNSGYYKINVLSNTQFQIPYDSNTTYVAPTIGIVNQGVASCARINLRTEFGAVKVIQGESIDINEPDSVNILRFIGMDSLSQSSPVYSIPTTDNTLQGFQNFNSESTDSVTRRLSRLTSMMADRVQDRGSITHGRVTFRNETSGSDQIISSNGNLYIEKPGSPKQIIDIPDSFNLSTNQALVASINRESNSTIIPVVETLYDPFLLDENKIILFYRFSDTSVYSWQGVEIKNSSSWTSNDHENAQNKNITVIDKAGVSFTKTTSSSGYFYYNSSSGIITVSINGSSSDNTINVSAINALSQATRTLSNGQCVWLRINRVNSKTFNNINTSSTYQDSDTNGTLYITNKADVPVDEDVFVIYALDNLVLSTLNHTSAVGNIYEEKKIIGIGGLSLGSLIKLPHDSRNNNEPQAYSKGAGQLEVYLNGQKLVRTIDWDEDPSTSNFDLADQIIINQNLVEEDVLVFRIASTGGVYFSNVTNFTDLQDAYDNERSITTIPGLPVLIDGGSDVALKIVGKIEIGNTDPGENYNLNVNGTAKFYNSNAGVSIEDGGIRFNETGSSPNSVLLKASDSMLTNVTIKLPSTSGLNNQIISTDGLGSLVWIDKNPNILGQMSSNLASGTIATIDPLVYRSFIGQVSIFISSVNKAETFHLVGSNNGVSWKMSQTTAGDSTNITIAIDNSGSLTFSDPVSQDKNIKFDLSTLLI